MNKFILGLVTLLTSFSLSARAQYLVDAPSDEEVKQIVAFNGKPGVIAQAAILQTEGSSDPQLLITHQTPGDVRYKVALTNSSLGLTLDGLAGTESSISVSSKGSLQINQQNESVGRNRFSRTLTVSYRNGQYVISGYTYSYRDTITTEGGSCDYNLLTGKGQRNGRNVSISTKAPALATFIDNEKYYTCKGW